MTLVIATGAGAAAGPAPLQSGGNPQTGSTAEGDLRDTSIPPLLAGAPSSLQSVETRGSAPAGTRFQQAPNAPVINIWYGSTQKFGQAGDPQKWVNILGNVTSAATLSSLTYSLNGGPSVPLTVGPNGNRLVQTGDFNVELDYTDLQTGNNTVLITATDSFAATTQASVTVNYQGGGITWSPQTYTINWGTASSIGDVAQVVDGSWVIDSGAVRPTVFDFDRLIAIGDLSWRDYTVTVPVTVSSANLNKSPGVGMIVRWQGHYDVGTGETPYTGWRRLGAMAWWRYQKGTPATEGLQLLGHRGTVLGEKPWTLSLGTTYIFKASITSAANPTKPATYRFKVWPSGQPEPAGWDLESQGISGEPASGSLLLVAHHVDAKFGTVTVNLTSTQPKPTLQLSKSGTGSGDVTAAPQKATYRFGEAVSLTAAADNGSTFENWQGDASGSDNPTTVEMFGNRAVNAVFVNPNVESPVSDDFNGCELDNSLWTFINPLSDASLVMTGGQAQITVPAGTAHDIWTSKDAPRIMQFAADEDFEFDAKFDSPLSKKTQMQGVLVEGEDNDYVRFNYQHDGSTYRVTAYSFDNGAQTKRSDLAVGVTAPMYLRVKRVGDVWVASYSDNGTSWITAASFQFEMVVNSVGAYVGNASGSPETVGLIDYFFNKNSPISPEDPDRKLTVTVNGSGSVSRSPDKENYACDEEVTLTAIPEAGNKFTGWSGALTGTDPIAKLVMNGSKSVTASFETDIQYSLTVNKVGNGTVTKSPDKLTYGQNENVQLTAAPDLGYLFSGWSGDLTGSANPANLVMTKSSVVTATFTQAPARNLTINLAGNGTGTVTKSPDKPSYLNGEVVTLTATPGANTTFLGWSGDATGDTLQVQVIMDKDRTITATFLANEFTLTTLTDGPGTVTKNPNKALYYNGELVSLTVAPAAGYKFLEWSGDLTGAANPAQIAVTKNTTVTAHFVPDDSFTLGVTVVGDGSVTKSPDKPEYEYGDVVTLQAFPNGGWEFSGWSGGFTGTENPKVVTMTQDYNVTATFQLAGIYTLTVIQPENGTISVSPEKALYAPGEQVALTATASPGYALVNWTGDATGSANPFILTMNKNSVVSAAFDIAPTYTLTVGIEGSGTVTLDPDTTEIVAGTTVNLTAVPAPGFAFSGWKGDISGNKNPYALLMDSDKSVIATFTDAAGPVSDDFAGCGGVSSIWTWADALGAASYDATGSTVEITVPGGVAYEASKKLNDIAKLTQSIANVDFSVEAKLDSIPTQAYEMQGLVVEQDSDTFLRVDVMHDGVELRINVLTFDAGNGKLRKTQAAVATGDMYLLLRRTGDQFRFYYRDNPSASWTNLGSLNFAMQVQRTGMFAASYGASGQQAPGYTAVFDYFFDELNPIDPEDATAPGVDATIVGQGEVTLTPNLPVYSCGQTVELRAVPAAGWRFQNWSGELNGVSPTKQLTLVKRHQITATFLQLEEFRDYMPLVLKP